MTASNILLWLAETSLSVSVLLILVLIIRKPFARTFGPRAAYLLWLAPVARLFLPELAILPAPETVAQTFAYSTVVLPDAKEGASFDFAAYAAAVALLLWVTVAIAWFGYRLESQNRFVRAMLAASKPASQSVLAAANAIAEEFRVKRRLRIRICDEKFGPSVAGLFRPVIFLPADFESAYSAREQHLALAHEIAHLARRDLVTNFLAMAFQAAQWPNPLAHLAFRAFRADQEAACDAFVLARREPDRAAAHDYASAIVKSASGAAASPAHGLSLAHPVKERLMLLKNPKQGPLRKIAGGVCSAALIAAGLAATANYSYASDSKKASDDEVNTITTKVIEKSADEKKHKSVIVVGDGSSFDYQFLDSDSLPLLEDGDGRVMKFVTRQDEDGDSAFVTVMPFDETLVKDDACIHSDDGGEPVKLEWTEKGDGDDKTITRSVICLTGDDASPEKRAETLRKVIDKMEANAKKEEARRKRMIEGLRKQLKELEKQK